MTILNAEFKQLKLNDLGQILYQPDPSNPLPGEAIAAIRKGESALTPHAEMLESPHGAGLDAVAVQAFLNDWLGRYRQATLETLVGLAQTDGLAEPVQTICARLYQAMGILPRAQLQDAIKGLDPDMRQILRAKGVRLGPVLVFLPALNKPAAVRLRGLLWALWNERPLPAPVPNDGSVSVVIDAESADRDFYQSIGYPVYGRRAVRIDMLDRVISAIYDSAKDGKFQARHDMAEWLGCSIDDLYAVLEAMGHTRIAEEAAAVVAPAGEPAAAVEAMVAPAVKPALAFFHLKRGRSSQKPAAPRPQKNSEGKKKERKPRPRAPDKKQKKQDERPRVIRAEPKVKTEQSPFAVLAQLKARNDAP